MHASSSLYRVNQKFYFLSRYLISVYNGFIKRISLGNFCITPYTEGFFSLDEMIPKLAVS